MTKTARSDTYVSFVCFIVVAAVLAATATTARAGQYGPGRPFGSAELVALQEAEAFWGRQPALCTSRTMEVVAPGALGTDEEGHDVAGRATLPEGIAVPCTMWIEEDALGEGLCSLERHEYGHWLGLHHEDPELATMPGCANPPTGADGGFYVPPDPEVVARRQEWEYWRSWRSVCYEYKGRARRRCFKGLRREAKRLRRIYA